MDITGKITHILPLQTGAGKNGEWRKQEFVIETQGQYPKKICFALWGDKIDAAGLKLEDVVTVSFDPESREYNNKWYTDLKAWRVSRGTANNEKVKQQEEETSFYADKQYDEPPVDDLPF